MFKWIKWIALAIALVLYGLFFTDQLIPANIGRPTEFYIHTTDSRARFYIAKLTLTEVVRTVSSWKRGSGILGRRGQVKCS